MKIKMVREKIKEAESAVAKDAGMALYEFSRVCPNAMASADVAVPDMSLWIRLLDHLEAAKAAHYKVKSDV